MRKKLLSLIMVFCFTLGLTLTVSANDNSSVISYEHYSQTLIDAYEKHGVEIELYPLQNYTYTQELLNDELSKIEENINRYNLLSTELIEFEGYANELSDSRYTGYAMYVTKTASATTTISDLSNPLLPCTCQVKVTANLYTDLQHNSILAAYAPTLVVMSGTGFDDWIELQSYTTSIDNSSSTTTNHYATYSITALLKTSVSVGGTTSWAKVTKNFNVKLYPFK